MLKGLITMKASRKRSSIQCSQDEIWQIAVGERGCWPDSIERCGALIEERVDVLVVDTHMRTRRW